MPINNCRVCAGHFFPQPLLRYENMPRAAQHLPDASALASERGVDLRVRQCSACGLVQLDNEPVSYHKDVVRAAGFSPEMRAFRTRQFGSFLKKYELAGRKIVEIGCGRGEYLSLMNACGAEGRGLEHDVYSVRQCLKSGLKVSQGYPSPGGRRIPGGPFAGFFMLNFLEHMPDPHGALRAIGSNLKAGGIGLIEVPNFDMITRKKLFSEFIPDHLFYFDKETLNSTLQRGGFEILESREVWHEYSLSAVVRKREPLNLSAFSRQQSKLTEQISAYLARFGRTSVAVWGAGHQALAVLALAGLSGKIKYVVDSAPFKQGKYTPASHVPIVSPDKLAEDPVEAVIVMAASYSDEVARTLRGRFGGKIRVAILRDFGLEIDPTA